MPEIGYKRQKTKPKAPPIAPTEVDETETSTSPDTEEANASPTFDENEPAIESIKKLRGQKIDPQLFYKLTAELPKEEWHHFLIYIYRVYPRILRELVDPSAKKYISCLSEPLSEQWILQEHGSGEYEIKFCDINRKPKNMVCRVYVEINNPSFPPVLDPRELDLGWKRNQSYIESLKRQGVLDSNGMPIQNNPQQPTQAASVDPNIIALIKESMRVASERNNQPKQNIEETALGRVVDMMSKGSEKSMELILSQLKQNDPQQFVAMITALSSVISKPSGADELTKHLLTQLTETQKQNTQLMLEMIKGNQAKANSSSVDEMLKWKEVFESLRGAAEPASEGKWEKILQYAMPVVGTIGNLITSVISNRGKAAMAPNPGMVSPMSNPTPAALPEGTSPQPAISLEEQKLLAMVNMLQQYGGFLVSAINRGDTGDKFAEAIETLLGIETGVYPQIAALGTDGIIQALQLEPNLWSRLQPFTAQINGQPSRLEKFISEFVSYGEDKGDNQLEGEEN